MHLISISCVAVLVIETIFRLVFLAASQFWHHLLNKIFWQNKMLFRPSFFFSAWNLKQTYFFFSPYLSDSKASRTRKLRKHIRHIHKWTDGHHGWSRRPIGHVKCIGPRNIKLKLTNNPIFRMELVWHGEFNRLFAQYLPHVWCLEPTFAPPSDRWRTFKDSAKVRFSCQVWVWQNISNP